MRLQAAALVLAAAALSGCGSDIRPIPTGDRGAGGFDGLIFGRLVADPTYDGGCLWLETDNGRLSIVWPYGYSARFGSTVEVLDETGAVVARAGEDVRFGGGIGQEFAPQRCRVNLNTVLVHSVEHGPVEVAP